MPEQTPLELAIELCGGVSALAKAVGVSQPAVSNWLKRESIPPERVLAIEAATNGRVSRHELAPIIYPREQTIA